MALNMAFCVNMSTTVRFQNRSGCYCFSRASEKLQNCTHIHLTCRNTIELFPLRSPSESHNKRPHAPPHGIAFHYFFFFTCAQFSSPIALARSYKKKNLCSPSFIFPYSFSLPSSNRNTYNPPQCPPQLLTTKSPTSPSPLLAVRRSSSPRTRCQV